MHLDVLINIIYNGLNNFNLDYLMVMLSNLEYLQDVVMELNCYDIDINNKGLFFKMLFQCQDLSVQFINGMYVNCITVDNIIYTVHPHFIYYLIKLFKILEFFIFLIF
jgi:hypothetical protein